jgi:uridine kinase
VAFEVTLVRAQQRDLPLFGNVRDVTQRYQQRYIPGQKLYLETCCPRQRADLVVENNDPGHPVMYEVKAHVASNGP